MPLIAQPEQQGNYIITLRDDVLVDYSAEGDTVIVSITH